MPSCDSLAHLLRVKLQLRRGQNKIANFFWLFVHFSGLTMYWRTRISCALSEDCWHKHEKKSTARLVYRLFRHAINISRVNKRAKECLGNWVRRGFCDSSICLCDSRTSNRLWILSLHLIAWKVKQKYQVIKRLSHDVGWAKVISDG